MNAVTIIYNILKLKDRRGILRRRETPEEALLWSMIRKDRLGVKFRRQHSIGGYIADFYCPEKKLIIELDGYQHLKNDGKEYDANRTKYFEGLGITVLRFGNIAIRTNINFVIQKIIQHLSL